ncbi:hypothetical protein TNCV_1818991 [Trichonephila clavipes]|nr:hypothetical protein TNCV_1818991 [Trichonephila clavipes]
MRDASSIKRWRLRSVESEDSSSWQGARFSPVVSRGSGHHTCESVTLVLFHPNVEEEHPGEGQGLQPVFPFHQPEESDL